MTRKRFSSEFKAKVAIEALKAHKTINELATEFDVHPTQINGWKKQLMDIKDSLSRQEAAGTVKSRS